MFDTFLHALATAAASLVCVPIVIRVMAGSRVLDIPNPRSSHSRPVPLGGGLGMLAPWLAGMILLWILGDLPFSGFPVALAVGVLVMAVIGFIDDVRNLPPLPRLLTESVLVAACLVLSGLRARALAVPGFELTLGWEGWLVSWLFVVGFTNMFNFMDGINGIAGFQTLIGAGGLAALATLVGDPVLGLPMALLAGGGVGFLYYNFPRARVFMGDVGSLPIGFALAMGVLRLHVGTGDGLPLWLPVLMIWPFLFDATYTLVNRTLKKRNPFRAHRSHAYQRLVVSGWSHAKVALLYGALGVLTTAAALIAYRRPAAGVGLFWGIFGVSLIWTVVTMARIRASDTES
jgi:UDP-N-acetylmuramyl pentapeptide phosphotransferase/UDP-N-acetylglucosamine-1-phosphate transferase